MLQYQQACTARLHKEMWYASVSTKLTKIMSAYVASKDLYYNKSFRMTSEISVLDQHIWNISKRRGIFYPGFTVSDQSKNGRFYHHI